jgi:16S rRNA pseudouridine516 synthase
MEQRQRLDKFLAHMQFGSRREVKTMVRAGRVTINGQEATGTALPVCPGKDVVAVDGQPVKYEEYFYLMLNKPAGYLTATKDRSAPTVLDLVPEKWRVKGLAPVGRLDKDTEGLLLLTTDGLLAHRLLSPKSRTPKTYFLRIDGKPTADELQTLASGVVLADGYRTRPAEVKLLTTGSDWELVLTIYEGKFHQVKRMLQAVGKQVIYLQRRSMGTLRLDPALALGECRPLTLEEINGLKGR